MERGKTSLSPNGDKRVSYCPREDYQPQEICLSSMGQSLLELDSGILDLLTLPRSLPIGYTTQETIHIDKGRMRVAAKRIFPQQDTVPGTVQFAAIRVLQEQGIRCATPLIANRFMLVSEWVDGSIPEFNLEFQTYRRRLDILTQQLVHNGSWMYGLELASLASRFRLTHPCDEDYHRRYTAVDPICHTSSRIPNLFWKS